MLTIALTLFSSTAFAQSDSVATGIRVIEEFYTETTKLVERTTGQDGRDAYEKSRVDRANEASSRIRAMRWLETPGTRRFDRVRGVVVSYTDSEIDAARSAYGDGGLAERLTELKDEKLGVFDQSRRYETYVPERRKPVPGIDPAPHEGKREEGEGIYFR